MTNIELKNKTILVTGAADSIGSNLILKLFATQSPITIIGVDSITDYYDISIKEWHLTQIKKSVEVRLGSNWIFIKGDIAVRSVIDNIFKIYYPDIVVNLAA